MTEKDGGEPLLFQTAFFPVVRLLVGALGLLVIVWVLWDHRANLWPPHGLILVFVCVALMVGGHFLYGSLFGWSDAWTVRSGEMELVRRNVFTTRKEVFRSGDIAAIELNERRNMDDDPFWSVEMLTTEGRRFRVCKSVVKTDAENARDRIVGRLAGAA